MPTLHNHILTIDINEKGAELQRIYNKQTNLEYLWNGDPQFWAKHSPVLFPVVGELKNGSYTYRGKTYELGRHGFARDMQFTVSEQTETSVAFSIRSNAETLAVYPFHFSFTITYSIRESRLYVLYTIKNTGDEYLYFSVGGHPAFNVPLTENTNFEDYYLSFSQVENAQRYPLSQNGLIETAPTDFFQNADKLPLQRSLFYEDALVFKEVQSKSITLKNNKDEHGLTLFLEGFPYLGIWNKKGADFLCIEPWCGIADNVSADGDITNKEGINILHQDQVFEKEWSVELF